MRRVVALATLLLSVAAPAVAAQPGRIEPSCPPAGARAVLRSDQAVVYLRRAGARIDYGACARRSGRAVRMGQRSKLRNVRLAGRFVAFDVPTSCFTCGRARAVRILDLRRGTYARGSQIRGRRVQVRELALNRRGSAAWIATADSATTLRKLDSDGEDELDSGALSGLRLSDSELSWIAAGSPRSVQLDTHPSCSRRGSVTALRTPDARAFYWRGRTYGCLHSVNRAFQLGDSPSDFERLGVNDLTLAGPFAAFDDGFGGRGGSSLHIAVVDLRDGRQIREFGCCRSDARISIMHVLALAPSGAVAWTHSSYPYEGPERHDVLAWSETAAPIVLDAITSADGASLALDGTTLRWTNAGEPRSAELR